MKAILEHEDIAESAVVGIPDSLKGQIPVGLCVLRSGKSLLTTYISDGDFLKKLQPIYYSCLNLFQMWTRIMLRLCRR